PDPEREPRPALLRQPPVLSRRQSFDSLLRQDDGVTRQHHPGRRESRSVAGTAFLRLHPARGIRPDGFRRLPSPRSLQRRPLSLARRTKLRRAESSPATRSHFPRPSLAGRREVCLNKEEAAAVSRLTVICNS